jgi:hypothetical protein
MARDPDTVGVVNGKTNGPSLDPLQKWVWLGVRSYRCRSDGQKVIRNCGAKTKHVAETGNR